jgi:hypothetical protein
MAKTKYGKYIIEDWNGRPKSDVRDQDEFQKVLHKIAFPVLYLDNNMIEGAFYTEFMWFHSASTAQVEAHTHDFDEILAFLGSDKADYHNLCGEIEFWLDDEKHILTKSCMIFIPKGLKHSPLVLRRVDKPILHCSFGPAKVYDKSMNKPG